MPEATRQRNLFVAEDWRVIYRAFTEVNFNAYDFDTIRNSMIDYVRINFPEDFNDWIESSEFVSIIELLAYLGQSLAFRTDLNTRENFLDTAERRESVLRLARLVSYQPQRNKASTGLLKITLISTTQNLTDSNGTNIANRTIRWNDPINPDWFEQFILIMNNMFSATNPFGRPKKEGLINGIPVQLYELNNDPVSNKTFAFNANVNNQNVSFEIVNPDFTTNETFFEREPDPLEPLHLIYRNDGRGNSSNNTGFFLYFKQGVLRNRDYNISVAIENRIIDVESTNVNDEDVFVHEIDQDGFILNKWIKVPAIIGNNVIFNSLEKNVRNIYNVITKTNDAISIRFADGRFGSVPTGLFRVWYRESANRRYTIKPEDIRNQRLDVPYFGATDNNVYFVSLTFSLQNSISNSAPTQTSSEIKQIAPQVYYTQDRMVNGEDYNVFPLKNSEAARIHAVNRIHSGFSRFIDINDPTGQSQNLNLFAEDGILYIESNNTLDELALPTTLSDTQITTQVIQNIIQRLQKRHFFYFHYPRFAPTVMAFPEPIIGVQSIDIPIQGDSYTFSFTPGVNQVFTVTKGAGLPVTITLSSPNDNVLEDTIPLSYPMITNTIEPALVGMNIDVSSVPVGGNRALQFISTDGIPFTIKQVTGDCLTQIGISPNKTYYPRRYGTYWRKATNAINSSTGRFFIDQDGIGAAAEEPIKIGTAATTGTSEFHINTGSLVRFNGAGWVSVVSVNGDGDTILSNGNGAVTLAENVSEEDFIIEIIMPFNTVFDSTEITAITQEVSQHNTFGIRYDRSSEQWRVITGDNLAPTSTEFSFQYAGDTTGTQRDSSWLLRSDFSPTNWRFIARGLDYIFESEQDIQFFFASDQKIVDVQTGKTVEDTIKVLKVNPSYSFGVEVIGENNMPTYTTGETIIINGNVITLSGVVAGLGNPYYAANDINTFFDQVPPDFPPAPNNPNRIRAEVTIDGALKISSTSDLILAEGSGSALDDLGFDPDTYYADFTESNICHGLGEDKVFNIEELFSEDDGFINNRRVKISFTDNDDDGVPDDPTIFEFITQINSFDGGPNTLDGTLPEGTPDETELFWVQATIDGYYEFVPTTDIVKAYNTNPGLTVPSADVTLEDGDVIFIRDGNIFYLVNSITDTFDDVSDLYYMRRGRKDLYFQWKHYAPIDNRIDPAITNIIDIYVLTVTYDTLVRLWIDEDGDREDMPVPPTNEELKILFQDEIKNKMLSDEIVWHSVKYKVLFGSQADDTLQARFKVTKIPGTTITDGEIKSRIVNAINEYFAIGNFDFGETFYFTELAAFIHQRLATIIGSVVIVPLDDEQKFGDLFQVRSNADEIFISAAKVSDIQIVDSFNDSILRVGR